jgi:hypothetical protein
MGTFIVLAILAGGIYHLRKAAPKILRFATENAEMCRGGGMMLRRMFGR